MEEITNAYRKMSRLFHPDKHAVNEKTQQNAQRQFTKIKRAYEGICCHLLQKYFISVLFSDNNSPC